MPPGNIDMSVIQAALARRAGAPGAPAGGTTMPAQAQQSQPGGMTPTGNPNVPGTPIASPVAAGGGMPPQQGGAPQQAQPKPKQMPGNFDDETKNAGKVLISQLLKYL